MANTKRCTLCRRTLALTQFSEYSDYGVLRLRSGCRACVNERRRKPPRLTAVRVGEDGQPWKGCSVCKEIKPVASFGQQIDRVYETLRLKGRCKACEALRQREARKAPGKRDQERMWRKDYERRNPDYKRRHSRNTHYKQYGLTAAQADKMREDREYKCDICGRECRGQMSKALALDHCHTTGMVRGMLCLNCNRGLGSFRDDPALIEAALAYLDRACKKQAA